MTTIFLQLRAFGLTCDSTFSYTHHSKSSLLSLQAQQQSSLGLVKIGCPTLTLLIQFGADYVAMVRTWPVTGPFSYITDAQLLGVNFRGRGAKLIFDILQSAIQAGAV